jgi:outer membrane usher protein
LTRARRGRRAALALVFGVAVAEATQLPERPADLPPPAPARAEDPCSAAATTAPVYVPRLLRVVVNESDTRTEYVFLQRRCGALLARAADLRRLRIRTAGKPAVAINGERYVNLNTYDGLTYDLDEAAQTLAIEGEPRIFIPTVIDLEHDRVPRTAVAPGAFLNYGLFTADRVEGGARNWTGTATLGVFGEPGVLISDWLFFRQSTVDQDYRLATTFFRDYPERIASLRVGDVYARGGAFGSTAALGGVQYATNFLTRPWLITSPVEMMTAATRRLSIVNLFSGELDEAERQSRAAFLSGIATAPHGPVEIVNIPTYQNGLYVLTLRDAQGREHVVRQPFFFSQGLLRQGLHDFSYEAGARRESLADDRYGDVFAAGTHRYGFSARLTGEAHVELAGDGQALGLTAARAVPRLGVLTATGALAHADGAGGTGYFGALGLENSYPRYGYALRGECRSERFFLPSAGLPANPLACREFGSVSRAVTPVDSVSVTVASTQLRGQDDGRSYRVGWVTRRWRGLTLTAFGTYTEQPLPDYSVGVLFGASLATLRELAGAAPRAAAPAPSLTDPRRLNLQVIGETGRNRDPSAVARLSSSARLGEQDVGVRVSAGLVNRDVQTLSGTWGNRYLNSAAAVSRADGQEVYTAGAASGLAWVDGAWFATRPLAGSFAVVRLGEEQAGVRVNGYRTDADGDVLVTPMQAYRENPIAINGADLPMNARFDALSLGVTPRYRAAAVVRPRIVLVRDAILTVQLRDAEGRTVPLPTGAYATVAGSTEQFPTGEDGVVYVTGLEAVTRVTIHWNEQECGLDVTLPAKPPLNEIPELGPFVCEGLRP